MRPLGKVYSVKKRAKTRKETFEVQKRVTWSRYTDIQDFMALDTVAARKQKIIMYLSFSYYMMLTYQQDFSGNLTIKLQIIWNYIKKSTNLYVNH